MTQELLEALKARYGKRPDDTLKEVLANQRAWERWVAMSQEPSVYASQDPRPGGEVGTQRFAKPR